MVAAVVVAVAVVVDPVLVAVIEEVFVLQVLVFALVHFLVMNKQKRRKKGSINGAKLFKSSLVCSLSHFTRQSTNKLYFRMSTNS